MRLKFFANKAFTLIELMVVVSIIAVLAAIILSALVSARNKAYDSIRLQYLHQLDIAIISYKQDVGRYPYQDTFGNTFGANYSTDPTFLSVLVNKGYLSRAPKDPENKQEGLFYINGDGNFGGAAMTQLAQQSLVALECSPQDGRPAKAALVAYLDEGENVLFNVVWSIEGANSICYY